MRPESNRPIRRRPRWLPIVIMLLCVVLTSAAGKWQLDRAHQKERLRRDFSQGMSNPPIQMSDTIASAETVRMKRVEVEGEFVRDGLALLDNKTRHGVVGYEVVMPLRIRGSSVLVLINRGWIAAGRERSTLPVINTPPGAVKVTGIAIVPGRFLELGNAHDIEPVWQNLTTERYAARTGLRIQPFVVQQHNDLHDGLLRSWPAPDFGVATHYGYAAQWFAFCGLSIFLFVFFHVKSSRSKKHQTHAPAPGDD